MSSVELASAYVSIIPSVRGIQGKIGKALAPGEKEAAQAGKRQGGRFAGAFKAGVVGIGGALAAVGIGKFVTDAVRGAGELQQSIGAIESVFGKSSGKMQKWSANAAQNVGLTKNEFNELGTVLGAQLKNGGTAMDELAPKTNKLIGMGADMAAMFGGTTKEAVEAVSAALRGERDTIEKYGVSLTQASVDAKAAELGFKKVGGALSQEATQAATVALIMEQTADAHGTFAKEADTFAGAQQRMSAQWGNLATTLGGVVVPIMTKLFQWMNDTGLPALKQFGGWIMSDVVPALKTMGQWVRDNVLPVLADLGGRLASVLGPALRDFGRWIRDVALPAMQDFGRWIISDALPALGRLGRWFVENRETIAKFAGVVTAIMLPVLLRLAVRFAAVGVAAVVSSVKQVGAWIASQAAAVKAGVVHVIQSYKIVASWVRMGVAAVVSGAQTVAIWAMYKAEAIKAAAVYVAQSFRVAAAWARMSAAAVLSGIKTAAVWTGTMIKSAVVGAARFGVQVARVVAGWTLMAARSLVMAARMAASWIIALGPIAWITAAVIAIVALVIANWGKIKKWTVKIWGAIVDWVVGAWRNVKKWTINLVTKVVNWITSKFNAFIKFNMRIWKKIWTTVRDAWNTVKRKTREILTAVVVWVLNKFREVRNTGRKWWNKITGLITGAWAKIRDKSKEILRAVVVWVLNKFREVRDTGRKVWNKIKGLIGDTWDNIRDKAKRILRDLVIWVLTKFRDVRDKGREIWNKLKNIIGDVWGNIEKGLKRSWNFIRDKVFDPIKRAVAKIPNAFEKAKDGIGKAWSKLQSIAKKPVKFVVNRVINDGLIGTFNKIPGVNIPKIKLPRGFAKGGLAPKGWAMVGEEGPELVNFSNPGRVYTAKQTKAALGSPMPGSAPHIWGPTQRAAKRSGVMDFHALGGFPMSMVTRAASAWNGLAGVTARANKHGEYGRFDADSVAAGWGRMSQPGWIGYYSGQNISLARGGPNPLATLVHEMGHALGISHNTAGKSVMNPVLGGGGAYWPTNYDRMNLRSIYGPPGPGNKPGRPGEPAKPANPFAGLVDKLVDAIRERFPAGGMFIDAAVGLAKAGINKVKDWVGSFMDGIGNKIAGIAGNVVDGIKGFFGFAAKGQLHDNGGKILPGTTLVDNQSRKPEALLNANQWSTAHRAIKHVEQHANQGAQFPRVVRLVVGEREFDAYVDTRAVAATGGALNAADDRLTYGGKYVGGLL